MFWVQGLGSGALSFFFGGGLGFRVWAKRALTRACLEYASGKKSRHVFNSVLKGSSDLVFGVVMVTTVRITYDPN